MESLEDQLLTAFDGHDVAGIRTALDRGADAAAPVRGKLPLDWLLEEYTRSDRLKECLRLLLDRGAAIPDELLRRVLLDDGDGIRGTLETQPHMLKRRYSLRCAFASLRDVTPLHVAAEYGYAAAARALIDAGADVNARAGVDANGMNGHTPIFHTVNANRNRSAPVMEMLLDSGADCTVQLDGLWWGQGYAWETIFFDVTPISFAQMGLIPQVHRSEMDIYSNIGAMLRAAGRPVPPLTNVPNRYLSGSH